MTPNDSLMRFAGCWFFPTDRRTTERISGHRYAFTVHRTWSGSFRLDHHGHRHGVGRFSARADL